MFKKGAWVLYWLACCLSAGASVHGATVYETTQLAASTAAADATLPAPITFDVTAAGNYTVALRDQLAPQALESLRAIVTRDLNVVAQLQVTNPAAAATDDFDATPGTYRVHVLGELSSADVGGSFGVSVVPTGGGAALLDRAGVIPAPSKSAEGQSTLQTSFSITQPGTYTLTLNDANFPAQLTSVQVLLLFDGADGPEVVATAPGSFNAAQAGSYQLLILAKTSTATKAGLYGVRVESGSGAVLYQSMQPVGTLRPGEDVALGAAGTYTLVLSDASFPASLTALSAVVTQNGAVLGTLNGAGSVQVSAAQGTAQIFARGTPNASEGVGAFGVQLTRGGLNVYADMLIADDSNTAESPSIFSVAPRDPVAAGTYRVDLQDFVFPTTTFASLKAAMTQGAAVLGTFSSPTTSGQFNLQSGRIKVLVAARPPSVGGEHNALFGLTVTPAGGTPLLETTQGVGGIFRTHLVQIQSAGPYDLTLKDLAFPALLPSARLLITSGTAAVAQVLGSTTVLKQQLAPGTYVLNVLAEGAAYGSYGLKVANSPSAPVVTLTADATSITSGQNAALQWSASDATGCTAAGGWTGAKSASGTQSVGPLNVSTTFDLSCTGPGGTGTASVSITVNSPSSNRGGGGAMTWWWLGALAVLAGARRLRRATALQAE